MKRLLMILLSCALIAACGNQTRETETGHTASINNEALQKVATQALNTAVKEHAQSGNVLVMDLSGKQILDYSAKLQGDSLLVLPNGHESAIEPGALLSPMLLASIIDDPNMYYLDTAMRLKVGRQYYPGPYCVVDDGASIGGLDSMPLREALAAHSNVAMCELGEFFYSDCRDSLKARIFRMFPHGRVIDLKVGSAKDIKDIGRIVVEGKRQNPARRFYLLCRGYGLTVYPKDILDYYNSLAGGHSQSDEILKDLLIEEVETGVAAHIKTDTDAYTIAGRTATIANLDNPSRCTACCVGFFPADNPLFSCMVTLYESTEPGRSAAVVFRNNSDELMRQMN